MIPRCLKISGFLSYRDPVELDFTGFDLACVSGHNGAGKSTLLDAMTWVLFGQARRRDESLINLQSRAAEVTFTFVYEGAEYRVQRSLARGKAAVLEFQVRPLQSTMGDAGPAADGTTAWRPLTERTLRDTQARIEQVLRLDYDSFVNASFFLQGKADQFAQQSPAKRKDVLSNILGMEVWESYKTSTADLRRSLEAELSVVEGRLGEIGAELAEEAPRRQRLTELEADLQRLATARTAQAAALEDLRKVHAALDRQRLMIEDRSAALDRSRLQLAGLLERFAERDAARSAMSELTRRASDIEAAFLSWRKRVQELERWNQAALAFRDHQAARMPLLEKIGAARAHLEAEKRLLLDDSMRAEERFSVVKALEAELLEARQHLERAEAAVAERVRLQAELGAARENTERMKAENSALKKEMDQLQARITALTAASGASCPLCGQPLTETHRLSTLESLQSEGKQRGDQYRANRLAAEELQSKAVELESALQALGGAEQEMLARSATVAQLSERLESLNSQAQRWDSSGRIRLAELEHILATESYEPAVRAQLASLDQELAAVGYDAAAHDRARLAESELRSADEQHRLLESSRAGLAPLEDELRNLGAQIEAGRAEIGRQESEVAGARKSLAEAEADLHDISEAEGSLFDLQEQENLLNQEVGAARQRVAVLEDLRLRNSEFETARQSLALDIGRHKVLERAFGKDGVPALLIEQALPEIESRANEILDRLSDGQMSVRFSTQIGYKDKKRDDLRETLEIQISDGAGPRAYEMYSGGEAFRVDFAIRLALSQVLSSRKGARLQTLVIDEGFGSQDNQGRQRLIEAINLIRHDFAKILLITHLEELKDAFPTRIEVEKTERGSTLKVMS